MKWRYTQLYTAIHSYTQPPAVTYDIHYTTVLTHSADTALLIT